MSSNRCGVAAPQATPNLDFEVEIVIDQGALRWAVPSARIVATTTLDQQGTFRLVDDRVVVLRPEDRRRGLSACALRRFDVVDGRAAGRFPPLDPMLGNDATLQEAAMSDRLLDVALFDASLLASSDGGDAAAQREGSPSLEQLRETVGWALVPGADCSDFIGVGPGQFVSLPCEMSWQMDAQWRPDARVSR